MCSARISGKAPCKNQVPSVANPKLGRQESHKHSFVTEREKEKCILAHPLLSMQHLKDTGHKQGKRIKAHLIIGTFTEIPKSHAKVKAC